MCHSLDKVLVPFLRFKFRRLVLCTCSDLNRTLKTFSYWLLIWVSTTASCLDLYGFVPFRSKRPSNWRQHMTCWSIPPKCEEELDWYKFRMIYTPNWKYFAACFYEIKKEMGNQFEGQNLLSSFNAIFTRFIVGLTSMYYLLRDFRRNFETCYLPGIHYRLPFLFWPHSSWAVIEEGGHWKKQ